MQTLQEILKEKQIQEVEFLESQHTGGIQIKNEENAEITADIFVDDVDDKQKKHILKVYLRKKIKPREIHKSFKNLQLLQKINFNSLFDFSELLTMSYMFYECYELKEVDFGKTDFTKIECADYMFDCCYCLETLKGFHFNFPSIKSLSGTFQFCKNLKSIDLSKAYLPNLEMTSYMFFSCIKLEQVDMSTICSNNIKNGECMFCHCTLLKSVTINNLENIKYTNQMFGNCVNLKTVTISSSLSNITYCKKMFYHCSSLEYFDFQKLHTAIITDMSQMFTECEKLTGEVIFPAMTYYGENIQEMFFGCYNITKVDMTKIDMIRTKHFKSLVAHCYALESIEIGKIKSDLLYLDNIANNCKKLKYFSMDQATIKSVESAANMLKNCRNLKVLRLGFGLDRIREGNYMLHNCSQLVLIESEQGTGERHFQSGKSMFKGCKSLKALNIKDMNIGKEDTLKDSLPTNIKLLYTLDTSAPKGIKIHVT